MRELTGSGWAKSEHARNKLGSHHHDMVWVVTHHMQTVKTFSHFICCEIFGLPVAADLELRYLSTKQAVLGVVCTKRVCSHVADKNFYNTDVQLVLGRGTYTPVPIQNRHFWLVPNKVPPC